MYSEIKSILKLLGNFELNLLLKLLGNFRMYSQNEITFTFHNKLSTNFHMYSEIKSILKLTFTFLLKL
jgi:hypothetical protein